MHNINLEFNQKGGKSMKKMATEAMMSTNGGAKYHYCPYCPAKFKMGFFSAWISMLTYKSHIKACRKLKYK